MIETSDKLHRLYERGGESAVQKRRDEVERQKDRLREQLKEVTNRYLTALAAMPSAQQLIEIYDASDACGDVHHFVGSVLWEDPIHVQLEIPNEAEIPDHVEEAIDAVEEESEDECSSGYWRREKEAVAAITKEEKTVFRVSDRKSLEQLYEQAEAKRDQLNTKVEKHHDEFERLGHELTRHDNFLSKVLTGEVGEEKLPNIFEGRPTLRDHAAEIVKKYRSDPDSLPEGHGAGDFKEKWTPDSSGVTGHSKVNMIQRAIREVSLADKYNDPESFCDLVERLVKRHDTVQP